MKRNSASLAPSIGDFTSGRKFARDNARTGTVASFRNWKRKNPRKASRSIKLSNARLKARNLGSFRNLFGNPSVRHVSKGSYESGTRQGSCRFRELMLFSYMTLMG